MIDRRVLSVMVFTYFLQALDKGTLSFAVIMGIKDDLHLHGQQYSWLTTCIYIAILIVEYPINYLIQRLPVAKYLGISIIVWGSVLALHATMTTFTHAVVLRTLGKRLPNGISNQRTPVRLRGLASTTQPNSPSKTISVLAQSNPESWETPDSLWRKKK